MATIQCSKCQNMIDSTAQSCPACGTVVTAAEQTPHSKKSRKALWFVIAAAVVVIGAAVCLLMFGNSDGWSTEDGYKCYLKDGEKVVGFQEIDGQTYYFSSSGHMETGFQRIYGDKYYFTEDGVMQTGWQKIEDETYLFDEDGIMETGWQKQDGKTVYLKKDGVMVTGWQDIDENTYYFDENGTMHTGWLEVDDNTYYLDIDGVMQRGITELDDQLYYLGVDGAVETGWVTSDEDRYFINEDGTVYTGWKTENEDKYYFSKSEDGKMAVGKWEINGKGYYFDEDGKMCTGTVTTDDEILYLNEDGEFSYRFASLTNIREAPADDVVSFPINWGVITTYYHELSKEITDASYISVTIETNPDATYRGDWQVYVRKTNGHWKYVGTGKMKSTKGIFEFELKEPMSFDAYTCIPAAIQSDSIRSSIRLNEVACIDYNFGPKNGKD